MLVFLTNVDDIQLVFIFDITIFPATVIIATAAVTAAAAVC